MLTDRPSALPHLEARIFLVDDVDAPFAANHPTGAMTLLERLQRVYDLHGVSPDPETTAGIGRKTHRTADGLKLQAAENTQGPPRCQYRRPTILLSL